MNFISSKQIAQSVVSRFPKHTLQIKLACGGHWNYIFFRLRKRTWSNRFIWLANNQMREEEQMANGVKLQWGRKKESERKRQMEEGRRGRMAMKWCDTSNLIQKRCLTKTLLEEKWMQTQNGTLSISPNGFKTTNSINCSEKKIQNQQKLHRRWIKKGRVEKKKKRKKTK